MKRMKQTWEMNYKVDKNDKKILKINVILVMFNTILIVIIDVFITKFKNKKFENINGRIFNL